MKNNSAKITAKEENDINKFLSTTRPSKILKEERTVEKQTFLSIDKLPKK